LQPDCQTRGPETENDSTTGIWLSWLVLLLPGDIQWTQVFLLQYSMDSQQYYYQTLVPKE
jgi:hypothetical protein